MLKLLELESLSDLVLQCGSFLGLCVWFWLCILMSSNDKNILKSDYQILYEIGIAYLVMYPALSIFVVWSVVMLEKAKKEYVNNTGVTEV